MAAIIAICLSGLEDLVISDIYHYAPEGSIINIFKKTEITTHSIEINGKWVNKGEAGCGKIIVKNVTDFSFISQVRSVQHWLVYMAESQAVPSTKEAGISHIMDIATNCCNFDEILVTWEHCLRPDAKVKHVAIVEKLREPSFCVRSIRDGDHDFSSLDVSRKLGEAILTKTKWTVDLCNMDFEVVAFILSDTVLIGMNIPTMSPPFLKSRLPGEIRPPVIPSGLTSGLRPSTAFLLIMLAKPEPGDVLVDAMCGCGATFIEAAYSHKCIALGGDVDCDLQFTLGESMQLAKEMSKNTAIAELCWWGAPKLPVRDGTVDIVVLDLPFGKVSKKVPKFYARARVPKHVTELARVLRPGSGRCVLLVQSHQHLVSCLDSVYFSQITITGVNIGGYICSIVTAQRTERLFKESISAELNEGTAVDLAETTNVGEKRCAAYLSGSSEN